MDKLKPFGAADGDLLTSGPREGMACPICKGHDFTATQNSDDKNTLEQGSLVFPQGTGQINVGPWMIQVVCDTCGYVLFFSSNVVLKDKTA